MQLRIAEQYVEQFGELAKEANTLVFPPGAFSFARSIARSVRTAF